MKLCCTNRDLSALHQPARHIRATTYAVEGQNPPANRPSCTCGSVQP